MNELQSVVAAARAAETVGKPALLATVVRVHGSAYRRPGARMLLTGAGWQAGSISGGCLEGDIERKAWWRTRSGEPVIVTYDSTLTGNDDDAVSWGFGLGCNGVVEVLLERLAPGSPGCPVDFIAKCLTDNVSGVMATVIAIGGAPTGVAIGQRLFYRADGVTLGLDTRQDASLRQQLQADAAVVLEAGVSQTERYGLASGGIADVLLEVIHPPIPLVICGAGHDVVPLADLANRLGWSVTVVDPRPGMTPRADRFPGAHQTLACPASQLAEQVTLDERTLAVVMSHNVILDTDLISALLASPVRYIGVLGPRRRTEQILEDLRRVSPEPLVGVDRIYGPVGLDIGADNPETIALSILAEMQAFNAGRAGSALRLRTNPIHPPASDSNIYAVKFAGTDTISTEEPEPFTCSLLTTNNLPASA